MEAEESFGKEIVGARNANLPRFGGRVPEKSVRR